MRPDGKDGFYDGVIRAGMTLNSTMSNVGEMNAALNESFFNT